MTGNRGFSEETKQIGADELCLVTKSSPSFECPEGFDQSSSSD